MAVAVKSAPNAPGSQVGSFRRSRMKTGRTMTGAIMSSVTSTFSPAKATFTRSANTGR